MSEVQRHDPGPAQRRAEQLDLFAADPDPAGTPPPAPAAASPVAPPTGPSTAGLVHSAAGGAEFNAGESNDMELVSAVLVGALSYGYFLTARGDCWRGGTASDPATDDVSLLEVEAAEAAMVAQLVARGWLLRASRTRRRAGSLRGRPSGQRRVELDVHPVTIAAPARAAVTRWSSLAAVPAQRRSSTTTDPGDPP